MNFDAVNLYLLIIIPIALLIEITRRSRRKKRLELLIDSKLSLKIIPKERFSPRKRLFILLSTLSLLILTCFRPQYGFSVREIQTQSSDIAIALDLSTSMLTEDIKPSRLVRAKRDLEDLLGNLKGERLALVAFAGVSFIELPLTLDYGTFKLFLDRLTPDSIPFQGTNIELAFEKSLSALLENNEERKASPEQSRAIVFITDGEDFSGDLSKIKAQSKKHNVKLFIVGIGTSEGGPIPDKRGYKKDKTGKLIISKLKEAALMSLANETGGVYVRSTASSDDTAAIYERGIKQLLESELAVKQQERIWNEYFQLPLGIALILLIGVAILNTRLYSSSNDNSKRLQNIVCFLLISAISLMNQQLAYAQSTEKLGSIAVDKINQGKYRESIKHLNKAKESASEDPRINATLGHSLYRLEKFAEAEAEFLNAAKNSSDQIDKAANLFNAGNSAVKQEQFEQAISHYNSSISLNPKDDEVKENLKFAKILLKKQKEQKKNQEQDSEKKKDKQEGDKKDKQESESSDKSEDESSESQEQQSQEESKDDQQSSDNQPQSSDQQRNKEQKDGEQMSEEESTDKNKAKKNEQSEDKKNTPQDEDQEQKKKEEDKSEDSSSSMDMDKESQEENQNSGSASDQLAEAEETSQDLNDQLESIVDSVNENRQGLAAYRRQKAMQQLKNTRQKPPEKDW